MPPLHLTLKCNFGISNDNADHVKKNDVKTPQFFSDDVICQATPVGGQ